MVHLMNEGTRKVKVTRGLPVRKKKASSVVLGQMDGLAFSVVSSSRDF